MGIKGSHHTTIKRQLVRTLQRRYVRSPPLSSRLLIPPPIPDTDVIIWEGDPSDPTRKPPETYTLIENFCLGTRRLEIFGRARSSLRRGWVTVLAEGEHELVPDLLRDRVTSVPDGARAWERDDWEEMAKRLAAIGGGRCIVPNTQEIETLRPKSPVRSGPLPGGGGVSGGVGVGVSGGVGVALGPRRSNMPPHQAAQNQMLVSPMMGMGMGGMGIGVGMPVDMGGWPGMGMGVNMNMAGMGMGNMNMPMMGMNMDGMGAPFHSAGQSMGQLGLGSMWMGGENPDGVVWDGMGDGMMMNGMGMGGMNGMGMNQWTQPGYDGFQ